jgi:DNA-binding NarL/FixJ family response regulator
MPDLTERQREVLVLVVAGLSNQQIADKLVISHSTARTHVSTIYARLGVANRAEAAALAMRQGLLKPLACRDRRALPYAVAA